MADMISLSSSDGFEPVPARHFRNRPNLNRVTATNVGRFVPLQDPSIGSSRSTDDHASTRRQFTQDGEGNKYDLAFASRLSAYAQDGHRNLAGVSLSLQYRHNPGEAPTTPAIKRPRPSPTDLEVVEPDRKRRVQDVQSAPSITNTHRRELALILASGHGPAERIRRLRALSLGPRGSASPSPSVWNVPRTLRIPASRPVSDVNGPDSDPTRTPEPALPLKAWQRVRNWVVKHQYLPLPAENEETFTQDSHRPATADSGSLMESREVRDTRQHVEDISEIDPIIQRQQMADTPQDNGDSHSTTRPDNDEDSQDVILAKAASIVLKICYLRDIGCGADAHNHRADIDCSTHDGFPCHGLSTTYTTRSFMSKVSPVTKGGVASRIGIQSPTFVDPLEFNRSKFLPDSIIQDVFEGRASEDQLPRAVCLRVNHQIGPAPEIEYDIDAMIAFPSSFTQFNQSTALDMVFTRHIQFNISTNIHLTLPVVYYDQLGRYHRKQYQIRHIPHLFIGTLRQFRNGVILIVFPRLASQENQTSWMTNEHVKRFFDIWIMVCRKYAPDTLIPYLPADYATAENTARARGIEHQSATRENVLKNMQAVPLPTSSLAKAWTELQTMISRTPGLKMFQDAVILVNAKNTKLDIKSASLRETLCIFRTKMLGVFTMDDLRYFADLGIKIAPPRPQEDGDPAAGYDHSDSSSAAGDAQLHTTYLWRRCCLEDMYSKLREHAFEGKAGTKQMYYNGLLRDAATMTIEPPVRSWIRKAGLVYIQAYSSVKQIEDAQQIYPFDHEDLGNLALAADILKTQNKSAKLSTLIQSYSGSKKRVLDGYNASTASSFSGRLELRIGDRLVDVLPDSMTDPMFAAPQFSRTPAFVWCIPTRTWCRFMLGNFNKITSVVEMAVLMSPRSGISLARSELIWPLLIYLQSFRNSNPARRSMLWKKTQTCEGEELAGFGLEETIIKHGFGWVSPVVDWQAVKLKPEYHRKLIECHEAIGTSYNDAVRLQQDERGILELCYQRIRQAPFGSVVQIQALNTVAHFVLRQYRRDVLDLLALRGELNIAFRSLEGRDRVVFCDQGLREAMVQRPFYVKGPRVCGARNPEDLFRVLMTMEDCDRSREFFDGKNQKPWRALLAAMNEVVDTSLDTRRLWRHRLLREYRKYMWCVAYPDPNGCFVEVNTPTAQRKFYAANDVRGIWSFAGHEPRPGLPPRYPSTLTMDYEEIAELLNRTD